MPQPRADRPTEFELLAVYNAERARGIVHTDEWDARMAAIQDEWDRQQFATQALLSMR